MSGKLEGIRLYHYLSITSTPRSTVAILALLVMHFMVCSTVLRLNSKKVNGRTVLHYRFFFCPLPRYFFLAFGYSITPACSFLWIVLEFCVIPWFLWTIGIILLPYLIEEWSTNAVILHMIIFVSRKYLYWFNWLTLYSELVDTSCDSFEVIKLYRWLVCRARPVNVVCWKRAICLEFLDKVRFFWVTCCLVQLP